MNPQYNNPDPTGTGPGSAGEENADMDRDMTADAETDKSAEAPGNDPAKKDKAGHTALSTNEPAEKKNGVGDHTNNGEETPGNRTDRAIGDSDNE